MCSWVSVGRSLLAATLVATLAMPAVAASGAKAADPAKSKAATTKFGFGKPVTAEEIAGWDIDVRPDGKGLPAGRGSVAQGMSVYDAKCASCHGVFGDSNDYMALVGGVGSLGSDQPIRTTGSKLNHATTLWDYINRAMPFQAPKTLTADEVYALTAYILHLNGILPADAELDRNSILRVKMPNRDGFTRAHGLASVAGKPDVRNEACMRDCPTPATRVASSIPPHARDAHGNLAEQMRTIGPVEGVPTVKGAATAAKASSDAAGKAAAPAAGAELAKKAGCMACHGTTQKIVGPGLQEIQARYAKETDALAQLSKRVKDGGSGVWGSLPMPPQAHVPEADIAAIVKWILGGAR